MAASSSHGDNPTFPDEVVMEILARLPAKSVGRCRCLSRAWRAVLSSDYFVDLHLRLANTTPRPQLLLSPVGSSYDGYIYSWRPSRPSSSPSGGAVVVVERLMRDGFGGGVTVPLTKPCRGLLLIRATHGGGYFVCNPSTGESSPALPDSEAPLKMAFRSEGSSLDGLEEELPFYQRVSYGLGYCAVSKAYKVARLFSNRDGVFTPTCCEVLVLGTPSYWRPSAGKPPPLCSVKEKNPAVFLNGHLHFLCCDGGITTINVSDETFGSLPPPPAGLFENETVQPLLTELDGSLCFCYGDPGNEDLYHIWRALGDHRRNKEQWMKLCCIDGTAWPESERKLLQSLWIAPLCVYHSNNGGRKIMFGTGGCKVFAVDLDCGGGGAPEILFTPDDTIVGSCEDDVLPTLGLFEESLVPVGRTVDDMVSSSPATKAWFDVLKWLPTRSVSELRSVCREWRGMIMSDSFIRSHVIHANMERSPRIKFAIDPRFGLYLDMDKCKGEDALQPVDGFVFVCSQPCHGLNVGSFNYWDFVCNPTVGYYQHMPLEGDDGAFFAGRIGLGFDTEIGTHILVRIIYKDKDLETRQYELECTARYLKEELWRPIDPPPRPVAATPPTFVDGKIYWMVDPDLGPPASASREIVAFDVKAGEFEVLQGPPCGDHGGSGHTHHTAILLQLQGALCVACSDDHQGRNVVDMWMMKDSGIWSMEYHILLDNLPANTRPLVDDPKDGRVLLNTGRSLGYYDPKTTAFETIYTMRSDTPPNVHFFPIVCHESLVCPLLPL